MNVVATDSIISEWLRSLGLQQYSSAFYDNGYDELELCKQIEEADLDAIGVTHPLHRKIILDSALILRSEGATSVYFTLEDVVRQRERAGSSHTATTAFQSLTAATDGPVTRELIYDVSPNPKHCLQSGGGQMSHYRPAAAMSPRTQNKTGSAEILSNPSYQPSSSNNLWETISIQLARENVDITASPYTTQSGNMCVAVVTALAMRYAEQLSQDYFQVIGVMESMIKRKLYDSRASTPQHYATQADARLQQFQENSGGTSREKCEMYLGHRTPPAVPSCPPPTQHSSHQTQKESNLAADGSYKGQLPPYQRSQSACAGLGHSTRMFNHVEPGRGGCQVEHTCGRAKYHPGESLHSNFLGQTGARYPCCSPQTVAHNHNQSRITHNQSAITHNHNISGNTRNQQCKHCKDPLCKEVAIFEQKRLEALMHVKAGKIGIEEGMARIKLYEKQRNACCEKKNKKKSTTAKIGEFFKLPSFRRKNKQEKTNLSKSMRSMSCSESGYGGASSQLGSSLSTNQLASDVAAKCTCGIQFSMPHSRSMTLTPAPAVVAAICMCEECQRLRGGAYHMQTPPSPMLGHRSAGSGVRGSARYPSARRLPIGADIVRAPPTCRQCHTPLSHPQKALPKFYSPQVTRKTYQPLTSPTPHHYIKPFSEKFDTWYQQNLPSDDETRNLIDPNQSDTDSSMNLSFDAFGPNSRSTNHSIVSPSLLKGNMTQNVRTLTPQPVSMPPSRGVPQIGPGTTPSDLGNCSYQSDSLSSDDFAHRSAQHEQIKQQANSDASPTVVRGRRDSGCYLSNENLNNNSSDSSTSEKAKQKLAISATDNTTSNNTSACNTPASNTTPSNTAVSSNSDTASDSSHGLKNANESRQNTGALDPSVDACGEGKVLEQIREQMVGEGIDLTAHPYTDEEGQWCVPISLVSRYAQLSGTDLTTTALAMDAIRCSELERQGRKWVALSADNTSRNPEQKRIASVHDFLVLSGLPMYTDQLLLSGCDSLSALASMTEEKLKRCGVNDSLHLEIILSAINSTWNTNRSCADAAINSTAPDTVSSTTLVHQV